MLNGLGLLGLVEELRCTGRVREKEKHDIDEKHGRGTLFRIGLAEKQ